MKIITKIESVLLNNEHKEIVEIRADSLTDVTPADQTWAVGSVAWIVKDSTTETGKFYGLTSSGEWVEQ